MLKLEKISARKGKFEIRDVSFQLDEGEVIAIIGPSGSGKTTLIETIVGVIPPTSGRIFLKERDITNLPPEKRRIAYVPQNLCVYPFMTVEENIRFGGKGMSDYDVKRIARMLRIEHLLGRKAKFLSGGEQQRVAIARALASNPEVIALDEAFRGLDISTKEEILSEFKEVQHAGGFSAVLVTHDFEEAYALADKVCVMNHGKILQIGSKEEVFFNPGNEFVAEFLGYSNSFEGYANGDAIETEIGVIKTFNEHSGKVKLFVHPRDVMVIREGKPLRKGIAENIFEGTIKEIVDKPNSSLIIFDVNGAIIKAELPSYVVERLGLREKMKKKETVKISLKTGRIIVLRR